MRKAIFFLLFSLSIQLVAFTPPEKEVRDSSWAQRTFDSLSVDERLAQLFMIEVRPTYGPAHLKEVERLIRTHQVGGIIFFKGDPVQQVKLTNRYQNLSKTKMLVAIDGEWGLAMRLSNTIAFPYQLGLGGLSDEDIIYDMGLEIGRQCKRIGVHINFAPVVDINNNPNNPIINYRSFGESPDKVARFGWAYASGMQDAGIIACAKHFPGHGDTDVDSHKDLPVIKHSLERLEKVEFIPFEYLINKGIHSVMTAHLYIPSIDDRKNIAISISDRAINGILRREMGFEGLAFTDALNMQGVAKYHPNGELELKALEAGNDVLLSPGDIPKATRLIKEAMASGRVSEDYVWSKVLKILKYKEMLGLNEFEALNEENVIHDLNTAHAKAIKYKLVERQLCLVKDDHGIVPIHPHNAQRILSVAVGAEGQTTFQKVLYGGGVKEQVHISKTAGVSSFAQIRDKAKDYDQVIVSLHNTSKYPPNYGITSQVERFVQEINAETKVLVVNFGNPYNLKKFPGLHSVLMAYQDEEENQRKAAEAVLGVVGVKAKLPVTVGEDYPYNSGVTTHRVNEISAGVPEEVGMSSATLQKIDQVAERAVRIGAAPGCQVYVVKNGRVVYNKSFGKHTSGQSADVTNTDLYDLASITKIAATTVSVMKLIDEGEIGLDDRMAKYIPELWDTDKADVTIRKVLEHRAGLQAWIPFYTETIASDAVYDSIYSKEKKEGYSTYVGDGLYILDNYRSYIFQQIYDSPLRQPGKYRYSDLGMILMKELIERVTGMPFQRYVAETFYQPLGLERMTFKPLERFELTEIVPTSLGPDMRKGLLHGDVHDPAAAMLGGVSGHAGLFGNAESLAILMQMIMNGGTYNGVRYLKQETIDQFTAKQSYVSRRGLGFDKPEFNRRRANPTSDLASRECFGHTGFTGTATWADPRYDLVYVFLSNRVYPTQENRKLITENVRTEIMDIIYESFLTH